MGAHAGIFNGNNKFLMHLCAGVGPVLFSLPKENILQTIMIGFADSTQTGRRKRNFLGGAGRSHPGRISIYQTIGR